MLYLENIALRSRVYPENESSRYRVYCCLQVQAQKDADAAHQVKELHARHASLRHSLRALHVAYTQLRLRLEDVVGHGPALMMPTVPYHEPCSMP